MICTCIGNVGHAEGLEKPNGTVEIFDQDNIQYYVKWDPAREPEDASLTEADYLACLEKDKNENGILDILEEDDEVGAAAVQTDILGDLNGDELVDNRDVVLLYRHFAGWEEDINDEILNFNGDSYTNINDAHHLLKYVSGWANTVLYSGKKYDITYHLYTEGMYVPEGGLNNPNPDYYCVPDGLTLKQITAPGYIFEGWYDGEGQNATRITRIAAGETGEIELFAHWTLRTYQILFDSNLVDVASKYYTIETGATLTNPSLANYTFVGWTKQDDGRLVNGIPKGSSGNMTLVANWAARRNLARPVSRLQDPLILEDPADGKIFFMYELGTIENIPLFSLYRFVAAEGVTTSVQFTEQQSISLSDAETFARAVTDTTTDSASWTLSEGWNDSTSISEETKRQIEIVDGDEETWGKSSNNTYRLDTTVGESEIISDSTEHAYKGTLGTGGSVGQEASIGTNTKYTVDKESSLESTVGSEIGVEGVAKINGSVTAKGTKKVGEETGDSFTAKGTATDTWNNTFETSGKNATTRTSSKNWNNTQSVSNSNTISENQTITRQISDLIAENYNYGQSYSTSGAHSSGWNQITANSDQISYSNTVVYDTSTLYTKEVEFTFQGGIDGYYRQVVAGIAHVFGIVGYDIATRSYFMWTFTVMDDETYEFLDYSKTTATFDDNERGVLPFEIPVFVNNYVNAKIARSDGLEISLEGIVTGYSGDEPIVTIPSYADVDNGDGTYSHIKVTGLATDAFRGNQIIQGVIFSDFITAIPDSAFEGCTALRDVNIPNLTSIGGRAFYGCTSLSTMTIPEDVTYIGADAFYDVGAVKITAANKNVALAAINSGAKSLVLNIASIEEAMDDTAFDVPLAMDVFELQGGRKEYRNLRVKSFAGTTKINGVSFVDCTQVPLEFHSASVDLNQVTISGSGFCMILANDNCAMNLFGTNSISSSGGNAIVCANTTLANSNSSVQARLEVAGNIYVCGSIANAGSYLYQSSGSIIQISQETYNQYINGVYQLIFDPNGGWVAETERTAYSGVSVGTLPIPTRTGYTFVGWYTALSGGNEVTATDSFFSSSQVTVYALWSANPCTVTYNGNGGTPGDASKTVYYGSTYGTLASATRTGYTFTGWYTAASGGSKVESSTTVTTTSDHTLYAHWTANVYTVSYNGNEGTSSATSKTVTYGGTYGSLTTATRTGYTFAGWYTAASGGSKVESSTTVTTASNHTLYANWTANIYTVTYNGNGGTSSATSKTVTYGSTYGSLTTATRTGYTFVGWYTAASGGSKVESSTSVTATSDHTLYAHWTANSYTYNIVYKSSNGTSLGSETATYNFGTTNTISAPAKSGYNTPSSQSVAWDSTSAKTITFTYSPTPVSAATKSGTVYNNPTVTYSLTARCTSRTATSAVIEISLKATIEANGYNIYGQYFKASSGSASTNVQVVAFGSWQSQVNYSRSGTGTGSITVPLSTTNATSATVNIYYYQTNSNGTDMTQNYGEGGMNTSISVSIPAY